MGIPEARGNMKYSENPRQSIVNFQCRGRKLVRVEDMNPHFAQFVALPGGGVRLGSPMATPELDEAIEVDVASSENLPWMCIVWDDPVNLMSYVSYVFQTVLGYDKKRANELMMQVHTEGKAAVSTGERDKVEADVKKLQIAGLWATMQQAG